MPGKNGVSANGVSPLHVRTAVIELDSAGYEGWKATVRLNVPLVTARLAQSSSFDEIIGALSQIIIDWNFVDESGTPMKKPSQGGVENLPIDLIEPISSGFQEKLREATTVPKS